MDFLSDTVLLVRHLMDDVGTTYEYSDDRLAKLVYMAAAFVNDDIGASYTIGISCESISPEPSANFINLVSLKAACMLARSLHMSWARQDFRVTDGPTTVDVKGIADKMAVAATALCDQYGRAKLDLMMGRSVNGRTISTPNSEST